MICPIKLSNPKLQDNLECEPQCAIRASTTFTMEKLENGAEENIVGHFCGLMAIGHKSVQLDNMIFEPVPQTLPTEEDKNEDIDTEINKELA